MNLDHVRFWAKTLPDGQPGISVRDHCLNVGCVADALLNLLPPAMRALLPRGAATLAALHDVGKISPGFQQKCPAWMALNKFPTQVAETDHAKVSQWFLQQWFCKDARKLKRWLMAVGAHHGQSKGPWIKDARGGGIALNGPVGDPSWQETREKLAAGIVAFFGMSNREDLLPLGAPPNDSVLAMFAGLIAVADWIGSDEWFFSPLREKSALQSLERRNCSRKAVAAVGITATPTARTSQFTDLFHPLHSANALQTLAGERCKHPGLWIIEAPMGCGKTEAALLAASRAIATGDARGLYFALPTQTTSNRIHERVGAWLNRLLLNSSTLRLAHGASWLEEDQTLVVRPAFQHHSSEDLKIENPWAARSWFSSARRALLAPFGVGTVDQALLGVVAAKHFFVRLFGLAGKVVVLDEVHTYDLYTGTLLDLLVEQLVQLRCTVIVLSATLTRNRREQLIAAARKGCAGNLTEDSKTPLTASSAYPLLSGVAADGTVLELPVTETVTPKPVIRLRCEEIPFEQAAQACVEHAETGEVVLWIRNTVDGAQRSLDAVRCVARDGGPETALLHSRFPWFRRDELESTWLARLGKTASNRPQGAVVVATQVVEQSVDIDADFLLTDLAPTDMLLQRLGRLWRHERPSRPNLVAGPEVWIHAPNCESLHEVADIKSKLKGLAPPYAAYVLLRSAREWQRYATGGSIHLPDDIREILESTYALWPDEPAAWVTLRKEMEKRADNLFGKARQASNTWALPVLADDEGVQTRFSDYPTATLILLRDLESSRAMFQFTGLDGSEATAEQRDWSREAAVALHRNHVKVPAWWLRGRNFDHPAALKHYFGADLWALATVQGDNVWLNGSEGENTGLKYLTDRGVWREPSAGQPPSPDYDEDYESDD